VAADSTPQRGRWAGAARAEDAAAWSKRRGC